jgi:hypothetical protein
MLSKALQIDVGQERTDRLSLSRTCFAHEQPALFDDAYPYPLPYQAKYASIADSLLNHFHELLSYDRIEIRGDINFQDPSRGPSANDSSHFVQRLVLPSSGSEPVRAVEKILLINSIQYFDHRLLHDLILQGGNRDRSLLPVFLGNIHSAQRLGLILATLEPLMESLDVSQDVPFVFLVPSTKPAFF